MSGADECCECELMATHTGAYGEPYCWAEAREASTPVTTETGR